MDSDLLWGVFIVAAVSIGLWFMVRTVKRKPLSKIAELKTRDSGFDEQVFIDKVYVLFFMVMRGRCARDLDPVRSFLSEAVFHNYNAEVEKHLSEHTFNRLDDLKMIRPEIVDVRSEGGYDTILVRLRAWAKNYVVDEAGAKVAGISMYKGPIDEQWTFVRPAAATTAPEKNSRVRCPQCAVAAKINSAGECDQCHTQLDIAEFDWLVSTISETYIPDNIDINTIYTGNN